MREPMIIFFFHAPATPEIYTLSLHDALPIFHRDVVDAEADALRHRVGHEHRRIAQFLPLAAERGAIGDGGAEEEREDRKSTRLNSSHVEISYAVFCLKKKTAQCMRIRSIISE